MRTTNVETLKINYLSREQYEAACAAGTISDTELYFIPEDNIDLNLYATKEYVEKNGGKIDSISVRGVVQTIDENKNVDIDFDGLPEVTTANNNQILKVVNGKWVPSTSGIYVTDDTDGRLTLAVGGISATSDDSGNVTLKTEG